MFEFKHHAVITNQHIDSKHKGKPSTAAGGPKAPTHPFSSSSYVISEINCLVRVIVAVVTWLGSILLRVLVRYRVLVVYTCVRHMGSETGKWSCWMLHHDECLVMKSRRQRHTALALNSCVLLALNKTATNTYHTRQL